MPQEKKKNPRLIPYLFVFAFSLSVATIIYTGLMVGAPRREAVLPDNRLPETPENLTTIQEPITADDDSQPQALESDDSSTQR